MKAVAEKSNKKNQSSAVANNFSQQKRKNQGALSFVDNRSESRYFTQLQTKMNHNTGTPNPSMVMDGPDLMGTTTGDAPLQGVFQFNSELLKRLIALAWNHPYLTVGGLLAIAGLSWLGSRMLTTKPENVPEVDLEKQQEERIKNILAKTPEEILDAYYSNKEFTQYMSVTEPVEFVPEDLIKDLDKLDGNQAKIDTLFKRFNSLNFVYIGKYLRGGMGFLARRGDCRTLVEMFMFAAKAIGIDVDFEEYEGDHLVEAAAIHGRDSTGNVQDETHWFFENHYWCTFNDQVYDLLFKTKNPPRVSKKVEDRVHSGVTYTSFQNNLCMLGKAEAKSKLSVELDGFGIVKTTEKNMQTYIDQHLEK